MANSTIYFFKRQSAEYNLEKLGTMFFIVLPNCQFNVSPQAQYVIVRETTPL